MKIQFKNKKQRLNARKRYNKKERERSCKTYQIDGGRHWEQAAPFFGGFCSWLMVKQ